MNPESAKVVAMGRASRRQSREFWVLSLAKRRRNDDIVEILIFCRNRQNIKFYYTFHCPHIFIKHWISNNLLFYQIVITLSKILCLLFMFIFLFKEKKVVIFWPRNSKSCIMLILTFYHFLYIIFISLIIDFI